MLTSEAIDRAYNQYLYPAGVNRPAVEKLAAQLNAAATTMTLTGLVTYLAQTIVEVESELILTKEAETTTTVDLLERGYWETADAQHANGTLVYINPEYPRKMVFNAMVSIIRTLRGKGLYKLTAETGLTGDLVNLLTTDSGTLDIFSIHASDGVTYHPLKEGTDYQVFTAWDPPKIKILRAPFSGATLLINYKTDFTVPTTEADDLTTVCGVPAALADYLPMAAAGQLLMGKEFSQLGRHAEHDFKTSDVPPGAALSVGERMLRHFDEQIELAKRVQRERTPTQIVTAR